jgi:hypothetical protein
MEGPAFYRIDDLSIESLTIDCGLMRGGLTIEGQDRPQRQERPNVASGDSCDSRQYALNQQSTIINRHSIINDAINKSSMQFHVPW